MSEKGQTEGGGGSERGLAKGQNTTDIFLVPSPKTRFFRPSSEMLCRGWAGERLSKPGGYLLHKTWAQQMITFIACWYQAAVEVKTQIPVTDFSMQQPQAVAGSLIVSDFGYSYRIFRVTKPASLFWQKPSITTLNFLASQDALEVMFVSDLQSYR